MWRKIECGLSQLQHPKSEEILYNYNYDLEDAFDNLGIADQSTSAIWSERITGPTPQIAKRDKKVNESYC